MTTSLKPTTSLEGSNVGTQEATPSKGSMEASKIAPFEIEGTNTDNAEYPTGIKFALILGAAFLSLVLVGLVCLARELGLPLAS